MDKWRLTGTFAVKESPEGELSLSFESGAHTPSVVVSLRPGTTMKGANELARIMNGATKVLLIEGILLRQIARAPPQN